MEKWLDNIQLDGNSVRLELLSIDHIEGLTLAVKDGSLWELWYTSAPEPENVQGFIEKALREYETGVSHPFVIIRKKDAKIVGTTRYMNVDSQNKRLEIGHTWYSKSVQRTSANTECKYVLLQHAFENLECIAVEFRTHWHNIPSRNAIERLGAKLDGVLRNHKVDKHGCMRDTVVFSIINSEWNTVKKSLQFKLNKKY